MFSGMRFSPFVSRSWRLVRAGGSAPDPLRVLSDIRPVGGSMVRSHQTTLLVVRTSTEIDGYVTVSSRQSSDNLAMNLASALAARAEPVAQLPDLSFAPVVGWLVARPTEMASRDTQAGGDPTRVAELLARSMPSGSWLAASARPPRRAELHNTRRWYKYRLEGASTHHANEGEAVIASIMAGAQSANEVRDLLTQVASSLPGFDVDVRVRIARLAPTVLAESAAAMAAWGGVGYETHHWLLASAAGTAPALLAAGTAFGLVPNRRSRVAGKLAEGTLPRPAHKWLPVRRPPQMKVLQDGTRLDSKHGGYPLSQSCFLLGPSVFVGLLSPHGGTGSGAASTAMRQAPAALLDDIGPTVGDAGRDQQRVHVSSADGAEGTAIFGLPGRGKSVLVEALFAFDSLERVAPSGKQGRPGRANTLIAFESKSDGANEYREWAATTHDALMLVEVADASTPAIDLFAVPGTAEQRASFFVNAMVYAMGDNAIAYQSSMTLNAVFTAALLMTPDMAVAADLEPDASPVTFAHALVCGFGDEIGEKLAGALAGHTKSLAPDDPHYAEHVSALRGLAPLYGSKVTPAQRRTLTSAPMSKTKLLLKAESWWSPRRPKFTWQQALDNHWAVVVNTGVTSSGQITDEDITEHMSAMLMYSLRDAIMRTCSGWQDMSRAVTIFADELALLAGKSPEIVTWMRNNGRSYGVRPVFATQYPDQLLPPVRTTMMSFGTVFWFTQNNAQILADAAADLSVDGGQWSPADIANLEPYHAVVRATVGKRRQPAVPVKVAYWAQNRDRFAVEQGYPDTGVSRSLGAQPAQSSPVCAVAVPDDDDWG